MNTLKRKPMNFPKFFRRFVIAAVAALLLGSIVTGAVFRAQISEVIAYAQAAETQALLPGSSHRQGGEHQEVDLGDLETLPMTPPSTGAKAVLAGFLLLCLVVFGIYWLTVSAWLYQAAVRTGFHGVLWFLLALAGNLAAVILFLVVRSFLCTRCEGCGRWQRRTHQYCMFCGTAMYDTCPDCKTLCEPDALCCHNCGKRLHSSPV